jgi:hypothetical protein
MPPTTRPGVVTGEDAGPATGVPNVTRL